MIKLTQDQIFDPYFMPSIKYHLSDLAYDNLFKCPRNQHANELIQEWDSSHRSPGFANLLLLDCDYEMGITRTLNLLVTTTTIDIWRLNPEYTPTQQTLINPHRLGLDKTTRPYFYNLSQKFTIIPSNIKTIPDNQYTAKHTSYICATLEAIGRGYLTI